jgi:hypothetical protein
MVSQSPGIPTGLYSVTITGTDGTTTMQAKPVVQ